MAKGKIRCWDAKEIKGVYGKQLKYTEHHSICGSNSGNQHTAMS